MAQEPVLITRTQRKQTLGDRVRSIADQLKHETELQIKATSHILGAAAQIAENHDQLIDEVVDLVEEDINQHTQACQTTIYTVDLCKLQFKTLREAKAHFGLKASSWIELTDKLNSLSTSSLLPAKCSKSVVTKRLNVIERELKIMRTEIDEITSLLKQILDRDG